MGSLCNFSGMGFCRRVSCFILLSYLSFFYSSAVKAQQQDAVAWLSLNVEKKINKHFSASLFNQYILNQNYAELGLYFFDGGLAYKFNDHITIAANYRFINARNRDNFYRNRQQWYVDLSYAKGFGKFSAVFRTRYQVQYYGLSFEDNYQVPGVYSRNKLTVRYKLNWYYSLFVSEEIFYKLKPLTVMDSYRTFAGVSRQINLHHKIELSYGIQQQVNRKNKRLDYISGLSYYYRF